MTPLNHSNEDLINYTNISEDIINPDHLISMVTAPDCGAISVLIDFSEGCQRTKEISISNSKEFLTKLIETIRNKYQVKNIALEQNKGESDVKNTIAISSPHRKEALGATLFALEQIIAVKQQIITTPSSDFKEPVNFVDITHNSINISTLIQTVTSPQCNAIALFIGTTRNSFEGQEVLRLEYESYDKMALKEMKQCCSLIREQYAVKDIAITHRVGVVPVCEASIVIAISSPNHIDGLKAAMFAIDQVKATVPIWKKEIYSDNSGVWKENKECQWTHKDKCP